MPRRTRSETASESLQELRRGLEEKGFRVREVSRDNVARCEQCVVFDAVAGGWAGEHVEQASLVLVRKGRPSRFSVTVSDYGRSYAAQSSRVLSRETNSRARIIRSLIDRVFPDPVPWTTR